MLVFSLLSAALATPVILAPPAPDAATRPISGQAHTQVYGYHPYWGGDVNDYELSGLTHIAVFDVGATSEGELTDIYRWTSVAEDLVARAHPEGVKVHLCVTSFQDSINNVLFASPEYRSNLAQNLASLVNDAGADGVNVDVEGLDPQNRDSLTELIIELKSLVDEVYLATPAVDWSDAYDYEALGRISDGLFIMGYGYHWSGGDPGPIAPLYGGSPWSNYALDWTVDDYLDAGVESDKIILGLPLYGRHWQTISEQVPGTSNGSAGEAILVGEAIAIAEEDGREWDETTHTPFVLYPESQIWYDDIQSIGDKLDYAIELNLGVGFWALTYEHNLPGFWEMVISKTTTRDETELPEEDTGESTGNSSEDTGEPLPVSKQECSGCSTTSGPAVLGCLMAAIGAVRRRRTKREA